LQSPTNCAELELELELELEIEIEIEIEIELELELEIEHRIDVERSASTSGLDPASSGVVNLKPGVGAVSSAQSEVARPQRCTSSQRAPAMSARGILQMYLLPAYSLEHTG